MVVANNMAITRDRARADSLVGGQLGDGATAVEVAEVTLNDSELGDIRDASDINGSGNFTSKLGNASALEVSKLAASRNQISRRQR